MTTCTSALALRGVTFRYGEAPVVDDLDWSVAPGEFVGLLGPNGAGKTTALHLLAGLLEPERGHTELLGRPLADYPRSDRARLLGVVSQDAPAPFAFPVASVVEMGRYPYTGRFRTPDAHDDAIVREAMALVDVTYLEAKPLTALSGGERQRVLLARALAQCPRVLLLDEPVANLDVRHAVDFFRVVRSLAREAGVTVVTVLHDLSFAAAVCERVTLMSCGAVVADGTPEAVLTAERLSDVYGPDVRVTALPDDGLFVHAPPGDGAPLPETLGRAIARTEGHA